MDEIIDINDEREVEVTENVSSGNVKISADVISTIAAIAAEEVPGVYGMYSSLPGVIAEKLGTKKIQSKGVKVELSDGNVSADVYIIVKYGVKVRDVAVSVQENVKNNIETMTGMNVLAVNVRIEGVHFEAKEVQNTEKETEIISVSEDESEEY